MRKRNDNSVFFFNGFRMHSCIKSICFVLLFNDLVHDTAWDRQRKKCDNNTHPFENYTTILHLSYICFSKTLSQLNTSRLIIVLCLFGCNIVLITYFWSHLVSCLSAGGINVVPNRKNRLHILKTKGNINCYFVPKSL